MSIISIYVYIPSTAVTTHDDSICVFLWAAVPQAIPWKLLYTLCQFHLNWFAVLLLFCGHSGKFGQKVGVVVTTVFLAKSIFKFTSVWCTQFLEPAHGVLKNISRLKKLYGVFRPNTITYTNIYRSPWEEPVIRRKSSCSSTFTATFPNQNPMIVNTMHFHDDFYRFLKIERLSTAHWRRVHSNIWNTKALKRHAEHTEPDDAVPIGERCAKSLQSQRTLIAKLLAKQNANNKLHKTNQRLNKQPLTI